jgi:hypothetical protein
MTKITYEHEYQRPKLRMHGDWTAVIKAAEECMDALDEVGPEDSFYRFDEHQNFITSKVMEALYGEAVHDFINERLG